MTEAMSRCYAQVSGQSRTKHPSLAMLGRKLPCKRLQSPSQDLPLERRTPSAVMAIPLARGPGTEPCRGDELKPVAGTLSLRLEAVTSK